MTDLIAQMDAALFDRETSPRRESEYACHGGCNGATHASDCDLAGEPVVPCCQIARYGHAETCRRRATYLASYPLS